MDEVTISRAIAQTFLRDFTEAMDVDVAIAGAGPSGLIAAHYLAKWGVRTALFERQLRVGGGMPGGGMMFNRIALQREGKEILDDFGVRTEIYEKDYYVADSLEAISTLCAAAIKAVARLFNLMTVEDVVIREGGRITGVVLNWSAVSLAKLHVDPLAVRSKVVVDATGHDSEICHMVVRKIGKNLRTSSGGVVGEGPMWAEKGERDIVENTIEVYPGLIVAGMAANAVLGSPRMGAIFGGMLLSGKKAAELAQSMLVER